jgi:DnaJ-class molecular chaperone
MYAFEARRILGLSLSNATDRAAIMAAWKQKIKHVHPDKNTHASDATEQTQMLNEAKDTLLNEMCDPTEKAREEARDEEKAREKERAEKEAAKKQKEEDSRKYYEDMFDEMFERAKAQKRARYALNRKKRAPGTRAHRKSQDNTEGVQFMEEMKGFIKEKFTASTDFNDIVPVSDILPLFMETRENTTDLEKNLFQRHTRKLFAAAFPQAAYTTSKNKRCYRYVCIKK